MNSTEERGNLEFLDTFTIEQFKAKMQVSTIAVKRQQDSNKLFFAYGAKTGAVATKGIPTHPMISMVKGDPTERNPTGVFYLLHEEGVGNAETLATF